MIGLQRCVYVCVFVCLCAHWKRLKKIRNAEKIFSNNIYIFTFASLTKPGKCKQPPGKIIKKCANLNIKSFPFPSCVWHLWALQHSTLSVVFPSEAFSRKLAGWPAQPYSLSTYSIPSRQSLIRLILYSRRLATGNTP